MPKFELITYVLEFRAQLISMLVCDRKTQNRSNRMNRIVRIYETNKIFWHIGRNLLVAKSVSLSIATRSLAKVNSVLNIRCEHVSECDIQN